MELIVELLFYAVWALVEYLVSTSRSGPPKRGP